MRTSRCYFEGERAFINPSTEEFAKITLRPQPDGKHELDRFTRQVSSVVCSKHVPEGVFRVCRLLVFRWFGCVSQLSSRALEAKKGARAQDNDADPEVRPQNDEN